MKSSPAFCLVVLALTLFAQFGALYPIGDRQGGEELMVDNGGFAQQNDSIVNITGTGLLNVVVANNELAFGVCSMTCNAEFLVCYDGEPANQNVLEDCPSKCGFYVTAKDNRTSIMLPPTSENQGELKQEECEIFTMVNKKIRFRNTPVPSCAPKIENGMVKLNVSKASSDCPVTIRNAYIQLDTTTPAPLTATLEHASATTTKDGTGSGNGTTTATPPTFMEQYWWIFLLIGLVLVCGIVTGVVVYCVKCKKDKKSPDAAAAQQNIKESQSPVVQQSKPAGAKEDEKPQPSYLDVSSILSQKSLFKTKKEQAA